MLPRKPVSELFTVLGRAKQGKTERYRELMRHLEHTEDQFVHAPASAASSWCASPCPRSMWCSRSSATSSRIPRTCCARRCKAKYQLVFKHDRAGRLVDAQEFKQLRFRRALFAPELLEELRTETATHGPRGRRRPDFRPHVHRAAHDAAQSVPAHGNRDAGREKAALDYGQCIRDLAYTNIFAGDLLLKNFGVTRHGRVIFYDYDELCQVTDCRFRDMPQATNHEDEMRGEAWFYVADNDVFPETFINFLAFNDAQRAAFMRVHGEILDGRVLARRAGATEGRRSVGGAALSPAPSSVWPSSG